MQRELTLHPACRSHAATRILADVAGEDGLRFRFDVAGRSRALVLPPEKPATRADKLWQTTCFEAFLKSPRGDYFEFNFSPSHEWAAYHFTAYREGMREADEFGIPEISTRHDGESFVLGAKLDRPAFVTGDGSWLAGWKLALCAVIEERKADGSLTRSYWALAHPTAKPDFHHDDCFALELRQT